ncbi:hypothetical protein F8388_001521 [Cannabis sativa]|uniref:J domain-containing protein n=1 Tax=Cannabis sativa TaxID=3483 RepID=A0A7J6ELZ9_CANSA|nr:hypothetical protein F8388_001521 [Cannabis sativa]
MVHIWLQNKKETSDMGVYLDHYAILGLPTGKEGAKLTVEEIRKAYKTMAMLLHPDKNRYDSKATAKFQRLQSSYDILMNDKTRQLFDEQLCRHFDAKRRKMDSDFARYKEEEAKAKAEAEARARAEAKAREEARAKAEAKAREELRARAEAKAREEARLATKTREEVIIAANALLTAVAKAKEAAIAKSHSSKVSLYLQLEILNISFDIFAMFGGLTVFFYSTNLKQLQSFFCPENPTVHFKKLMKALIIANYKLEAQYQNVGEKKQPLGVSSDFFSYNSAFVPMIKANTEELMDSRVKIIVNSIGYLHAFPLNLEYTTTAK